MNETNAVGDDRAPVYYPVDASLEHKTILNLGIADAGVLTGALFSFRAFAGMVYVVRKFGWVASKLLGHLSGCVPRMIASLKGFANSVIQQALAEIGQQS